LTVDTTNNDTFAGVLQNGSTRLLALNKSGPGTLTLSGANTYTGTTTISGPLALTGTGSLASTKISITNLSTFDVSGHTGTVTFTDSQTLNGTNIGGTAGTINGNLTMGSTSPLTLSYKSGFPTLNVTNGTLTLQSGEAVTVTISGAALGVGDYTLISANGTTGFVGGTAPTGLTMAGSGLAAGTTGSLLISGSQLILHVVSTGNTISGTVFNDKGTTNIGAGKTVKLFVAGGSAQTTTTNGSGQYSFSSVSFNANDIITVFISGATEKGATVTLAPGTVADITGLDIFRDSLIVRHENAGPMTNSFLDTADPGDADLNAIYTVSGGTLTVSSGKELRVMAGKTFAPEFLSTGNVTTHDLVNAGTLNAGSGTLTIQGAFSNTGTFNRDTSTVFYDGTAQSIIAVNYYNLTFSNNAKTLASTGTIGIAGTFTPGTNTSHTTTNSTIEFNGTSAQAVPVFHTYNNLTLNNTAGTTGAPA